MTQFLYHVAQKMFRAMFVLLKCSIKGNLSVNLLKRPANVLRSNKTTNQMQQSIVKFIALSYRYCSTSWAL